MNFQPSTTCCNIYLFQTRRVTVRTTILKHFHSVSRSIHERADKLLNITVHIVRFPVLFGIYFECLFMLQTFKIPCPGKISLL